LFQKSYSDIQDKLISDVTAEAQRIKALAAASSVAASSKASKAESKSHGDSQEEQKVRALRSSGEDTANLATLLREKVQQRRPKAAGPAPPPVSIQRSLPEHMVREDFLEIVKDIEARAVLFASSAAAAAAAASAVSKPGSDVFPRTSVANGTLTIGNEVFRLGDSVIAFSVISQEGLSGVITAISSSDFVVRGENGLGPRFAFHLGQIKDGRVTITRDHNAITVSSLKSSTATVAAAAAAAAIKT